MSANSHPPAILQNSSANPNQPGDPAAPLRKSPPLGNLQVAPPPPTLEDRLQRANRTARCEHVKPNGLRCGSPALREEIYCYFHRLWRNPYQPDEQPYRPDANGVLWNFPVLENADAIQLSIQLVLDSVLANRMDLKRASLLLYGLQTAAVNVRRTHFDPAPHRKEISTELK